MPLKNKLESLLFVATKPLSLGKIAELTGAADSEVGEAMEALKKLQKNHKISEDDLKRYEKEVQEMTDKFIEEIGKHLAKKEKELTTV